MSSSSSFRSAESSHEINPYVMTLRTIDSESEESEESMDNAYASWCIRNPKKLTTPFAELANIHPSTSSFTSLRRVPRFDTRDRLPCEDTFEQIQSLATLAENSAKSCDIDAYIRIEDLKDYATNLAVDLLEARVEIERVKKQYDIDAIKVSSMIDALRTSKSKLEAERDQVQDLATRMAGIRLDHMTSRVRYLVQKAEYEHRAKETDTVQGKYKRAVVELDRSKEEREKELLMMATQMWSVKTMVGEMFARSEWMLREGMAKASEEIDYTLQRLEKVMNDSIESGQWGKKSKRGGLRVSSNIVPCPEKDMIRPTTTIGSPETEVIMPTTTFGLDGADAERNALDDMEQYTAGCGSPSSEENKSNIIESEQPGKSSDGVLLKSASDMLSRALAGLPVQALNREDRGPRDSMELYFLYPAEDCPSNVCEDKVETYAEGQKSMKMGEAYWHRGEYRFSDC